MFTYTTVYSFRFLAYKAILSQEAGSSDVVSLILLPQFEKF